MKKKIGVIIALIVFAMNLVGCSEKKEAENSSEPVLQEETNTATETVKCFVQANVSGEESKHGLTREQTLEFVKQLEQFSKIEVVGLMTMAPFTEDESVIRHVFQKLKQLQQEVAQLNLHNVPCTELSMGMSNDYEIAVEEGATFVRIGTALVG